MHSREQPSPRYLELIELYRRMHTEGDPRGLPPQQTFSGHSLPRQAHRIRSLVQRCGARTVLDYGCGKGMQYRDAPIRQDGVVRWNSIKEYWGVESIHCYDPAYAPFSELPRGRFDAVICTDVLEHCPETDIGWIVDGLFAFATKFVFANVACYPAKKTLHNGENAHCTIQPAPFWRNHFEQAAARREGLLWEVWIDEARGSGLEELRSANFEPTPSALPKAPQPAVWRMV